MFVITYYNVDIKQEYTTIRIENATKELIQTHGKGDDLGQKTKYLIRIAVNCDKHHTPLYEEIAVKLLRKAGYTEEEILNLRLPR